ncbi:MAG: M56 family metallopeptidase [Woeseiaceae bacterium]|nr:M56 family metallopeptidase [Woeseiaceae bacterium]
MSWLVILKVSLVLALALVAVAMFRRRSAAIRHALLQTALIAALLIPVLSQVLPGWQALPQPVASTPAPIHEPPAAVRTERTAQAAAVPITIAAREPVAPPVNWGDRLMSLWLIGVAALLAIFAARVIAMEIAVRRARPLTDRHWLDIADAASSRLGVRARVELRCWRAKKMPAAWGVMRPVILLPRDCDDWPEARRRSVIAHEMAHVARRDVAVLALANLACALHWFNPLVWILRRRLVIECEHASDDLALAGGNAAVDYADHLLETAAAYRKRPQVAPVMAARSHLEERIMAILDNDQNRRRASTRLRLTLAAVAATLLVPLSALTWAGGHDGSSGAHEHMHNHSDSAHFAAHLEAMGVDPADTDALIAGLTATDPVTRGASAWALGKIEDDRVIDPLIQAGYDVDPIVRQWAVRSLSGRSAPRIADLYANRLQQDNDPEVRQWAARSFYTHADDVSTQPLIAALDDENAEVREWAARMLASSTDSRVQPALVNRLAVETDDAVSEWIVRSLAAEGMGVEALVGAMNSQNAEVRQWAVRSLHGSRDERAADALITMLNDPDDEVREWSVRGLAGARDDRSVDALIRMLNDRNDEIREWSVRGLAGNRDDRAVDALIAMLNDRNDDVREWSVRGLGVCGNVRAVGALEAMRQDPNAEVAEWAGRSLDEIDCSEPEFDL